MIDILERQMEKIRDSHLPQATRAILENNLDFYPERMLFHRTNSTRAYLITQPTHNPQAREYLATFSRYLFNQMREARPERCIGV
jgi:hypothetical protein